MAMLGRVQLPDWKVWVLGVVPEVTGAPKVWQPAKDPDLDRRARALGITLHEDLTWWSLTDQLAARGDYVMAERAQRFAMPIMNDVIRCLADQQLRAPERKTARSKKRAWWWTTIPSQGAADDDDDRMDRL